MSLLDWNSIENSRHGITDSKKCTYGTIPLLLSRFVCSNSNSSIPHLEFSLVIQSNNLTYKGNTYTKYQQFLYDLCKQLHDKGYGYRKIAKMLNKWGLNTYVSYIFSSIKI